MHIHNYIAFWFSLKACMKACIKFNFLHSATKRQVICCLMHKAVPQMWCLIPKNFLLHWRILVLQKNAFFRLPKKVSKMVCNNCCPAVCVQRGRGPVLVPRPLRVRSDRHRARPHQGVCRGARFQGRVLDAEYDGKGKTNYNMCL